jgi:ACR3 family arsenite efflux pump ArsB
MIFAFLVFLAFFLISLYSNLKILRMSKEELQARVLAGEKRIGFLTVVARAPLAWLAVAFLGAVLGALVFASDYTTALPLVVAAASVFVSLGIATAIAAFASFRGRPRFLVHPELRDGPTT